MMQEEAWIIIEDNNKKCVLKYHMINFDEKKKVKAMDQLFPGVQAGEDF